MATKKSITGGDSAPPTVEDTRREIARLHAEAAAIQAAPLPLVDAEDALRTEIAALADAYDPGPAVRQLTRPGGSLLLDALIPAERADAATHAKFLAAMLPGALLGRWLDALRAEYAANPSLAADAVPLAERRGRLAAVRERVFALELVEERLILEAEARGMAVDRRPDVDVRALFHADLLAFEDATPCSA